MVMVFLAHSVKGKSDTRKQMSPRVLKAIFWARLKEASPYGNLPEQSTSK